MRREQVMEADHGARARPEDHRRSSIAPAAAGLLTIGLLCIPLLWAGIWLAQRHHRDCFRFLEGPILFVGISLMLASLLSLALLYCSRINHLRGFFLRYGFLLARLYMLLTFLLLASLLAFTLFALFVVAMATTSSGHAVPGASYREYRLGDFALWFQQQTRNPVNWAGMRSCIQDKKPCQELNSNYPTKEEFADADLSSIQSGCCKPPNACAFTFVTPTRWENTTHPTATGDCGRWDNDPSLLCYDCTSCRAGLLQNVMEDWSLVARVCLIVFILLSLVYILAWVGFLRALWNGDHVASAPINAESLS